MIIWYRSICRFTFLYLKIVYLNGTLFLLKMLTLLCNVYLSKPLSSYLVWVLGKKNIKNPEFVMSSDIEYIIALRLYWAQNYTAFFLPELELPEELCVQLCVCRNLWCRQTLSDSIYKKWDYWCKLTNSGTVRECYHCLKSRG